MTAPEPQDLRNSTGAKFIILRVFKDPKKLLMFERKWILVSV